MRVASVFDVSLYVLLALAHLLLIVGEGALLPQGIGFPVAVFALLFVDRWRVIGLSGGLINCGAVAAMLVTGWELTGEAPETRLVAAAHLLCYLSWLVMLGPKGVRQYWWLLTLAILQVAVGAALIDGAGESLYAALLVALMAVGIWTLTVFSLYRVEAQARAQELPKPLRGRSWFRQSEAWPDWHLDATERWIGPRFVLGVVGTTAVALGVATLFFLMIPRFWLLPRSDIDDAENDPIRPMTGFSETVQLGEIGEILESTEQVMSVQLVDRASGRPRNLSDYCSHWGDSEPLFRGTVMSGYRNGRWARRLSGGRFEALQTRPDHSSGFRQDIVLEARGTPVLFGVHPVEACVIDAVDRHAMFHAAAGVLIGSEKQKRGRVLRYSLFSPPLPTVKPQPQVPSVMSAQQELDYLALPRQGVNRLITQARELVAETAEIAAAEKADRLVKYLGGEGFQYTLDSSVADPSLDPVEDFLFRRREGHCEYFASALTLMLRAVGVPARLVSGFKGGTINRITGNFVVEQRHAHAWVEAWIDKRWVTLDPTPAARSVALQRLAENRSLWKDAGQAFGLSWRRYVVELSLNQQQELFYLPLQRTFEVGVDIARGGLDDGASALKNVMAGEMPGDGWLVLVVILFLLAGAGWVGRKAWKNWQSPRERNATAQRREAVPVVAFIRRFHGIMAAIGYAKSSAMTAREFSFSVSRDWQEPLDRLGLGEFPGQVANEYYAVRFGGRSLEKSRLAEIDAELGRLDKGLQRAIAEDASRDGGQSVDA